jgi:hypothetical protein
LNSLQIASLPRFFKPVGGIAMQRLGRKNDGGYLIDSCSIAKSDFLLSCGINDDWSFEKAFIKLRPIEVVAFDPTVSPAWLLGRIAEKPMYFIDRVPKYFDYFWFFRGRARHIHKFIGKGRKETHLSLTEALNLFCPKSAKYAYVKIDIEGSEYEVLDELIDLAPKLSGLAIEFHDVDINFEVIEKFIERFPLSLCHTHVNNYCWPSARKFPDVVELSFTSCDVDNSSKVEQPHRLDMPNDRLSSDVVIHYS